MLNQRLQARWHELKDSLWLIPSILTVFGASLALILVQIDHALWVDGGARNVPFVFGGGVDGARGVLESIAGSLITVTATVFSITVVTLQLAAGQMTPRVLRSFTGDRRVQFVLGVFIATFTYSLLVLRSVRSEISGQASFVPYIATTVAIALALLCVGVLIFFIHHIARSIQVSVVVERAASDTLNLITLRFPNEIGNPAPAEALVEPPVGSFGVVRSNVSGYLQTIDEDALFQIARNGLHQIQVQRKIGEFVLKGSVLARVWPLTILDEDDAQAMRDAFVLGLERTLQADLGLGVRQLTDIALKALSPGINDPTTAVICIDRICEVLVELSLRHQPTAVRTDDDGASLIVLPAPTFAQLTDSAFTQIRHYGAADPVVAAHMVEALGELANVVPSEHRAELIRQALLVVATAREQVTIPDDIARVQKEADWAS